MISALMHVVSHKTRALKQWGCLYLNSDSTWSRDVAGLFTAKDER